MSDMATIRKSCRTVVFISESPLTQRDAKLYGFKAFLRAGLSVEVWDVTDIYLPRARNQYMDLIPEVTTIRFSNEAELVQTMKTLSPEHVVFCFSGIQASQIWSHRRLLRGISKSPAIFAGLMTLHVATVHRTLGEDLWKALNEARFTRTDLKRLQMRLTIALGKTRIGQRVNRFCVRLAGIRPFDHIWAATQVTEISFSLRPSPSSITFIHSLDYEQFINLSDSGPTDPFICFIAGTGGLGGDSAMLIPDSSQLQAYTTEYFRRLNAVLDAIEKRFGLPVVIAAHPRVSPNLYDPWVKGRKVVHGQTLKLIAQSSLVLAHDSTSISMAVVMRKPLLLIYLGDFAETIDKPFRNYESIAAFSSMLSCATIDWTQRQWADKVLTVSTEVHNVQYDEYVTRIVKLPGTSHLPFWEIVLDTSLN